MTAAHNGHVEVVKMLIENSANVDLKCSEGSKAIDYSIGKTEIIELLSLKPKNAKTKNASAASKASASAGGGVARASGGAGQTVAKTLCAKVAAKILKDAEVQTDEPLQITLSGSQKRFAPSKRSAFTTQKPKTTAVPTGDASSTTAEQPSFEIMRPIAKRPQEFGLPSMQLAMAQPAAPQVFPMQYLILTASANGRGLFGLIDLLNKLTINDYLDAHQAEELFIAMGLDASVFAGALYANITGLELAEVLRQNIIALCGHDVYSTNIPRPEQAALMSELNQSFALYAQTLGN
jgi:hypothetical protein